MSVAVDVRIDVRPYSGYVEPALPIAAYVGQGVLVGDASGGTMDMSFIYQRNDDAQISEMFNLEQIAFDSGIAVGQGVSMRLVAMDSLSQNRPMFGQIWSLQTDGILGEADSALAISSGSMLPLWFGSPNRDEGDGLVRFTIPNVDFLIIGCTIQGYMWGPRSVLAPGGPQRPIGSLFGR